MLIVFEGIDGAGKRTQVKLLGKTLSERNLNCETISFPAYPTFFGRLIERYLNGEFGPLDQVDPHFSAMLFAGDRLKQKDKMIRALEEGKTLIADRYVAGLEGAHVDAAKVAMSEVRFRHQALCVGSEARDELPAAVVWFRLLPGACPWWRYFPALPAPHRWQ